MNLFLEPSMFADVDVYRLVAQQMSEMDMVRQKVYHLEQTQQSIKAK